MAESQMHESWLDKEAEPEKGTGETAEQPEDKLKERESGEADTVADQEEPREENHASASSWDSPLTAAAKIRLDQQGQLWRGSRDGSGPNAEGKRKDLQARQLECDFARFVPSHPQPAMDAVHAFLVAFDKAVSPLAKTYCTSKIPRTLKDQNRFCQQVSRRTPDAIAAIRGIEAPSGRWCIYSIRIVLRGFLDAFDDKGGLWDWTGVQFREDEKEKILNNTMDDYFSTSPANAS